MKELIYPDICIVCGNFFNKKDLKSINILREVIFKDIFSDILCPDCIKKISTPEDICIKCGRAVNHGNCSGAVCGNCLESKWHFNIIRSSFLLDGVILDLVKMLKYKDKAFLAKKMSWFMVKTYLESFGDNVHDIFMPIPMHKNKLRKRGYNQTMILALEILKKAKNKSVLFPELKKNILMKKANTQPQTGLNFHMRKSNLKRAFRVKDFSSLINKSVLLIDDVVTTGATIDECAKNLLDAGAKKVDAITFARTVL